MDSKRMCTNDEYIGTSNPLPFWGGILREEMSSKRKIHQSKDSDFIDVAFDVPRVHVSDSL